MKIAHLILAHKNPDQLELLIQALQHPEFNIFVHLDGKADEKKFGFLDSYQNVSKIVKRASVYWAGYGTIEATLNGFEQIIPLRFDYINVMSAQDYLIKTPQEIYKFFEENAGTEFISCESIKNEWKEAASRVTNYHLINYRFPGRHRIEKMITALLPARRPPLGYEIVGRANWFALTNAAAEYIFNFQKSRREYVRYFRFCWGADEFFFATILFNSSFKKKLKPNLTYVDWSIIKEPGHPKILGSEDFQKLVNSKKLFARKFDIHHDKEIIFKLRAWITGKYKNVIGDGEVI